MAVETPSEPGGPRYVEGPTPTTFYGRRRVAPAVAGRRRRRAVPRAPQTRAELSGFGLGGATDNYVYGGRLP